MTPVPHCASRSYGSSCGPVLGGRITKSGSQNVLDLQFSNGGRLAAGLLVIGNREIGVPLPGTSCLLLTNPLIPVPFRTDGQGTARWTFRAAQGLSADIRLQAADLSGTAPLVSNAVQILCVR